MKNYTIKKYEHKFLIRMRIMNDHLDHLVPSRRSENPAAESEGLGFGL